MRRKWSMMSMFFFVTGALLLMWGCDESALLQSPEPSVTATAETPVAQPPAATYTPTVLPAPPTSVEAPPDVAGAVPNQADEISVPRTLAQIETAQDVPITLNGRSVSLAVPDAAVKESTYVLTVDGLEYDTGIGTGSAIACYVADIDSDGTSEIIVVRRKEVGAELYLFQPGVRELRGAVFTYKLPAELSASGQSEERADASYLLFSGIEPVVSIGDGSFAVLTFGNAFERFVFDAPTMRVVDAGTLPLDILTGGEIPALEPVVTAAATQPVTEAA